MTSRETTRIIAGQEVAAWHGIWDATKKWWSTAAKARFNY